MSTVVMPALIPYARTLFQCCRFQPHNLHSNGGEIAQRATLSASEVDDSLPEHELFLLEFASEKRPGSHGNAATEAESAGQ